MFGIGSRVRILENGYDEDVREILDQMEDPLIFKGREGIIVKAHPNGMPGVEIEGIPDPMTGEKWAFFPYELEAI